MSITHRTTSFAAALCALAASSFAQSFNLDVGANQSAPLPATTYGAAANQPGFWSNVGSTAQSAVTLRDLATNLITSVTITPTGGYGDFYDNSQLWTGDDRALMADASDIANLAVTPSGGLITWVIAGLQAGNYTIYTYALAPDFPATYQTTVDVTGAPEGAQTCTGAWSGSPHVLGVSYAKHTISITAGQNITVLSSNSTTVASTNFGSVNGFQIVLDPSTLSTSFCSGDAVGTTCLGCGNNGGPGRGCANSGAGSTGALLVSSGVASVSADTLSLTCSDMTGPGLFFQSNGLGASPITFGDGMLCASVGIVRMGVVFPTSGAATYPGGLTPAPISIAGAPIAAPVTKHYQCWYRDALAFCTASTFNTSNGVSLPWIP
ncbi:MAG: hypothetical protein SGI72_15090 [Planctomycetota bacterium]|nr:hypothetical protein [Planctomycetota bacterium]